MSYNSKNIILSTTHTIDGYHIVKYLDVISAEAVYKLSLGKTLSNMLNDTFDSMRIFSNNELSGSTQLIQEAKDYVKNELIKKAKEIGANAIVGIDIESSVGADGMAKASINGTAVIIEPSVMVSSSSKIPVIQYNRGAEIKPFSISLSNDGTSLSIDLYCPFHNGLSGLLADVSLITIFDDSFKLENVGFINFSAGKNNHLYGNSVFCSIPQNVLAIIKNAHIVIKKYVENGNITILAGDDLILSSSDVTQNVSSGKSLSINDLLYELNALNTAREISDYLSDHSEQWGSIIDPELMALVDKKVYVERMYGNRKDACIDEIRKYFNLND